MLLCNEDEARDVVLKPDVRKPWELGFCLQTTINVQEMPIVRYEMPPSGTGVINTQSTHTHNINSLAQSNTYNY
jgi:hypothetical protein